MRLVILLIYTILLFALTACVARSDSAALPGQVAIHSFEDCVAAGYPIMRSLPAKCKTSDGRTFIDNKIYPSQNKNRQKGCKNMCGNGVCEQIVCAALDCPCPETPHSCPQDCAPSLEY